MPPIQQQQTSRGGLITALVIAIIFAIGCLVWAIMNNADLTKAQNELSKQATQYNKVIPSGSLSDIENFRTGFSPGPEADAQRKGTLVDIANEQRKALVRMITGKADGTEKEALDEWASLTKDLKANAALKDVPIPDGTSLSGIVKLLSTKVTNDSDTVKKAMDQVKAAAATVEANNKSHQAELAKRDEAVKAAQDALAKAEADCKAAIAENQKLVSDSNTREQAAVKAQGDLQSQQVVELQTRDRQLAELQKKFEAASNKLAQTRPDIKDAMIRAVDATITQVSPDNVCYINLGFGDHVSPGITFEVYPKQDGVPKLGDGIDPDNMPKGKASIEIISVGQNSSQCRILSTRSGTTLEQGDLCVNLVYDRNIKPVFHVYGKFDMDQNGVATDGEAEVIKNLISRWGGRVADKIGIDVDFVVLGKEPTIPNYTQEELTNPINKQKFDEAKAAQDAWGKVRDEAISLHIPVMNQDRFLYYTGYFDAAKR